jgi:hypothetical protein
MSGNLKLRRDKSIVSYAFASIYAIYPRFDFEILHPPYLNLVLKKLKIKNNFID